MTRARTCFGPTAALVLIALLGVTAAWAGSSTQDLQANTDSRGSGPAMAPPVSRDCDAMYMPDEYNDRIDCKTENVNVALYDYVDTVIAYHKLRLQLKGEPVFTDAQIEHLMSGRQRAQAAKNRSHGAKSFRGQAKKQKAEEEDCYTQEIIGDGKGDDVQPCVKGEDCEEVLGDGIGNDDGKCKLTGNNREVCVQVCQQPLADDDQNFDPDQAADTEKGLDEVEVALIDATSETQKAMDAMQAAYYESQALTDDCNMYQFDLFPTAAALQVAQVVKNTTGAAFNGCSVVCNQDAFGWNCEAACLVFAIIDGIANGIYDAFDVADGSNGSAQLDQVARCTTQLDSSISTLSASVDENAAALDEVEQNLDDMQAKLDAITAQLDALSMMMTERFNTVDGYLCVPQGQRECFPNGAATSDGLGGAGASLEQQMQSSPLVRRGR